MAQKVRKAVIPAAGFGTRFLPVTKSSPKEMLSIVDKPVIQYVVEEAISAGIEEIIFITNSNKRALEDYFDYNFELEERLKQSGKMEQYNMIREISDAAKYVYVRQKEAKGTGHAVLMAKELIGDEPFLVLWGDEFVKATPTRSKQLVALYEKHNKPVITVMETTDPQAGNKYGFVDVKDAGDGAMSVDSLIEKPGIGNEPSKFISISGQILTSNIFEIIEQLEPRKGEIWLTDAINKLAHQQPMIALNLENAIYYDSGSKFGLIKANIDYGLEHPETRDELLAYIKQLRET